MMVSASAAVPWAWAWRPAGMGYSNWSVADSSVRSIS